MRSGFFKGGLLAAGLMFSFGTGGAQAFTAAPDLGSSLESMVTPVAMCGVSCRSGGRYIPGPPSVCRDEGLRYCGPSRDRPTVVVPLPGADIVVGGERRRRGDRDGTCRTTTVTRSDGSSRTTRVCN